MHYINCFPKYNNSNIFDSYNSTIDQHPIRKHNYLLEFDF